MNCKMSDLKTCLEKEGFTNVKTVLSSGNVVFDAKKSADASLERRIEKATEKNLSRLFLTIVRSIDSLNAILDSDPFADQKLKPGSKRIVTFLKQPLSRKTTLPPEHKGARILKIIDQEIYTAYVPKPGDAAFMVLIEKTFGKEITTRTWETVQKVAKA